MTLKTADVVGGKMNFRRGEDPSVNGGCIPRGGGPKNI